MARLAGINGTVYVKTNGSFSRIADVYNWDFGAETHLLSVDIKGDPIERWIPSHAKGVKFTAKRRYEGASVWAAYVARAASLAEYSTWRLDLIDNNSSFVQITCSGYATKSSTKVPTEGIDEDFELQVDDTY